MRRPRWKPRRAAATRSCGNSRRRTRADEGKRGEAPYHPGMEKRVVFRSAWLPYALLAPQIVVTIVFFFWPAVQAFWFSDRKSTRLNSSHITISYAVFCLKKKKKIKKKYNTEIICFEL